MSAEKFTREALEVVGTYVDALKVTAKHQLAYYLEHRFAADPLIEILGTVYTLACRQREVIDRVMSTPNNKNKALELGVLAQTLRQTEKLSAELAEMGISLKLN